MYLIAVLLTIVSLNIHAIKEEGNEWRNKAMVVYKQALNEYNKGNYEAALKDVKKALSFYSLTKGKKLLAKIHEIGLEDYKAGTSLINFNPELALKYMLIADNLIDQKDKKIKEKISEAIEQLQSSPELSQHKEE